MFFNKKVKADGHEFDSKEEFSFYEYLKTKHKKSEIVVHPKFILIHAFKYFGKSIQAITYEADFAVDDIVYDVKATKRVYSKDRKTFKVVPFITEPNNLRVKLFKFCNQCLKFKYVYSANGEWNFKE